MSFVRSMCVAVALATLTGSAFAQNWNKKTKVSFNVPVEVPGVALSPGTYVFKLVDSQSSRHIVQITNERENQVYATVLAINDYRARPSGKTVITFGEHAPNAPAPVKTWFFPGDTYGQRFVYPKSKAVEIAAKYNQPVPHVEDDVHAPLERVRTVVVERIKEVPVIVGWKNETHEVKTQHPDNRAEPYMAAQYTPHDDSDEHGHEGEVVRLPTTASQTSLFGLLGLLLVGAGLGVQYLTRQTEG